MHIPPDWGTFSALVVSFLVFWFIFSRLFFSPFLTLLGERERRLRELADRTEKLMVEERAAGEVRERQMAELRATMIAEREARRREAEAQAAQMIEEAKAEVRTALEQVRNGIENDLRTGERELEELSRRLAAEVAARVLGRPLDSVSQALVNN